jgi:hypothetical protein
MHVVPLLTSQQSALVVHRSDVWEHVPVTGGPHTVGDDGLLGSDGRQKPPQHWSPVWQVSPFASHGSSAQKPRSLRVADWLGR